MTEEIDYEINTENIKKYDADWSDSIDDVKRTSHDLSVCPWCGDIDHDCWEYDGENFDAWCPNCSQPIHIERETHVTYKTSKR